MTEVVCMMTPDQLANLPILSKHQFELLRLKSLSTMMLTVK